MAEKRNAYSVLGLHKGATEDQIKQAYVALVKKFDPEKHTEKFMIIQDAFNRLKDPKKRSLEDILSFNEVPMDFSFTDQEKAEVEDARLEEAIQTLEARISGDPDAAAALTPKLVQAYAMRAYSKLRKKLLEEALTDWRRMMELDPTHQRAKNNLLCSYCKVGYRYASHRLYDEAIEEWEKAARMNPDSHLLVHNLALACEFSGKYDDAMRYWQETLKRWKANYDRNPADEYLKTCIIEAHRHQSEVAETANEAIAQQRAQAAQAQQAAPTSHAPVAQRPTSSPGMAALPPRAPQAPGAAPQAGVAPRPAAPAAGPAPQAAPAPPVRDREAELRSQLEILKLNPEDFDANFKVGKLMLELRKWGEAVAHFTALTQKWPQNLEIINALGFALMNNQQVEEAFRTWNRGLKLEPKNFMIREALIKAHMLMARALRDKNLFVNAIVHFKALTKLVPDSDEVHFELGRTYQQKGDKRAAFLEFNEVLKLNPKHKQARVSMSELKIQR